MIWRDMPISIRRVVRRHILAPKHVRVRSTSSELLHARYVGSLSSNLQIKENQVNHTA